MDKPNTVNDDFLSRLRSYPSLPALFFDLAKQCPDRPVYSQAHLSGSTAADAPRIWHTESYQTVAQKVARIATYLASLNLGDAPRIAIISYTRPEWMIADLGILSIGGTSVSIYQSVSVSETGYILHDSQSSVVFAENVEQVNKLLALLESPVEIPAVEDRPARQAQLSFRKIIAFEDVPPHPLIIQYRDIITNSRLSDLPPPEIPRSQIASLVYTSGTTGPPKGVIQTHENHLANLWQATTTKLFAPDGALFLFLPLAHSFARLVGYIGFLTPSLLKFPAVADTKSSALNASSVLRDLADGSAECVPMVPRILEKMRSAISAKASKPGLPGWLVRSTLESAQAMLNAKKSKSTPPVSTQLTYIATAPLRRSIRRKLFGPTFQHVVSGGAKLPVDVNEFFSALGITIYEGYGLTETCVATNVNRIGGNRIGSVGPCLPEIMVKIVDDGEICFKGPNITSGYLNRPQATAESWDLQGWFHTGDLGQLDADGFLFITGRKKELLVTSGGKKISPQAIEDKLMSHDLVANAVVLGDAKPYCAALIVPDRTTVIPWAKARGITLPNDLAKSNELKQVLQTHIDQVNETLSKFETVKRFRIIDAEFTVDNGLLTPTFKVKRNAVMKRYPELIDELFSSN